MVRSRERWFPPIALSKPSIGNYIVKQSEISNYNFNLHILVEKGELSIVKKSIRQTISSLQRQKQFFVDNLHAQHTRNNRTAPQKTKTGTLFLCEILSKIVVQASESVATVLLHLEHSEMQTLDM